MNEQGSAYSPETQTEDQAMSENNENPSKPQLTETQIADYIQENLKAANVEDTFSLSPEGMQQIQDSFREMMGDHYEIVPDDQDASSQDASSEEASSQDKDGPERSSKENAEYVQGIIENMEE